MINAWVHWSLVLLWILRLPCTRGSLKCAYSRNHSVMPVCTWHDFLSMHVWWYLQDRLSGMLLHSLLHSRLQGRGTHLSQLPANTGACFETQVMSLHSHNGYCTKWPNSLYPIFNFRVCELEKHIFVECIHTSTTFKMAQCNAMSLLASSRCMYKWNRSARDVHIGPVLLPILWPTAVQGYWRPCFRISWWQTETEWQISRISWPPV